MCEFFSCIVTTSGDVLFTEEDSHDTVIERCGFNDDLKSFVRIEYTHFRGYIIDEKSIPEWYERLAAKARKDVKVTHNKVVVAYRAMKKLRTAALDEYNAICTKAAQVEIRSDYVGWMNLSNSKWRDYWEIRGKSIKEYKEKIKNVKGYVCERV